MSALAERISEIAKCLQSFEYFCDTYCRVLDTQSNDWLPFHLWDSQRPVARLMQVSRKMAVLKARQIGLTWMAIARALQQSILLPNSQVLMYSYRDDEATVLLTRLIGMYDRLPAELRFDAKLKYNAHVCRFPNGSEVRALPTTAGDSYTANLVVIDEADIVPNLSEILRRVKPTVDNGGQLFLISRANKDKPDSIFKRIYRAAKEGSESWDHVFLGWDAHPKRSAAWYAEQVQDQLTQNAGSEDAAWDYIHEQYPATDVQALSARRLSKRLDPNWVEQCFENLPQQIDNIPAALPGLVVWAYPTASGKYVIGSDVAEGKETSDDSAAVVLDSDGNQTARLSGKIEISTYSEYLHALSKWYNNAGILVERNNHGHAVIERLRDDHKARLLRGRDGRYGYLSDVRGKAEMYSALAERCKSKGTKIRDLKSQYQILSIERATLRAPEGLLDDCADAYAIGVVALDKVNITRGSFELV